MPDAKPDDPSEALARQFEEIERQVRADWPRIAFRNAGSLAVRLMLGAALLAGWSWLAGWCARRIQPAGFHFDQWIQWAGLVAAMLLILIAWGVWVRGLLRWALR